MGMFFVALVTISLDGLPPDSVPAASGLNNFLRITSGSFATSLTTTFWDRREALHQSRLVESLSAYDPGYSSALAQLQPLAWWGLRRGHGAAAGDRSGLSAVQSGYLLFLRVAGDVADPTMLAGAPASGRHRRGGRRIEKRQGGHQT